jgi:septation ring formation regulator EzrA
MMMENRKYTVSIGQLEQKGGEKSVTNSNDRLDRIEALLESASRRIDSNARAVQANSESINVVAEAAGRTLRAVDELREIVEEDKVNFREFVTTTRTTLDSINASLEQQGRILDYLLRRNGEGGKNGS